MARSWLDRLARFNPWIVGQSSPPYHVIWQGSTRVLAPRYFGWDDVPHETPDVVILSIKWRRMSTAREWIGRYAPQSLVISLMNGMGQEEALAAIPDIVLSLGTTTAAATRVDADARGIVVKSVGTTTLPLTGDPREEILRDAGAEIHWRWTGPEEMYQMRWLKLVQNSVINPLTALADCPNGALVHKPLWRLAPRLIAEARTVAAACDATVPADALDRVESLLRATGENLSSMAQDVRLGLETEIEAINGYIVKEARRHELDVPLHQSLVSLLSALTGP